MEDNVNQVNRSVLPPASSYVQELVALCAELFNADHHNVPRLGCAAQFWNATHNIGP